MKMTAEGKKEEEKEVEGKETTIKLELDFHMDHY